MTLNRFIYGCLLFLSFLFAYFYGGVVPYMLLFTAIMLPLLSLAYTLIIYYRFKYFQEVDKKFIIKGDTVNYNFIVSNEDFMFYPYIKVTFYGTETIFAEQFRTKLFSLQPYSSKTFTFKLHCKYSGNYEIGVKEFEFEDFLGIFKLTYREPFPLLIQVYPRVITLNRFKLKMDFPTEFYSSLTSRYEDIGTLDDIRKYTYGDNLKKVHWKLTAKLNELMVRKFQGTIEASAVIMLDLKKSNLSYEQNTIIEDKLIESAISVAHYCLQSWIPINLVYYTKEIVNIRAVNPYGFQYIYDNMAQVRFIDGFKISDILSVYTKNNIVKSNLLIFTADLNYELYENIYNTTFSGFNVILVYISPEEFTGGVNKETENIIRNIHKIGASVYKLNIKDDIKLVLEG